MRLAKYLAMCGVGSRRFCENLILEKRITVNDKPVESVATNVLPTDIIALDDNELKIKKLVYYLLNKPIGYTASVKDSHADKLITELVPPEPSVWPVGRLDRETTGLIILTNDGELTFKLTHPKYKKEKEYIAQLDRELKLADISRITKKGIVLEDGPIIPDGFQRISDKTYQIIIHEGRKRLIRRLFKQLGSKVIRLERIRIANLYLNGIAPGKYRSLTDKEIKEIQKDG